MVSKTIPDSHEQGLARDRRGLTPELAPSPVRAAEPNFVRWLGMIGLLLLLLGVMTLILRALGRTNVLLGIGWASMLVEVGLLGMLFHAAADKDWQVRRSYAVFGLGLLALGVLFFLLPAKNEDGKYELGHYFGLSFLCLGMSLLFLLASVRHETELTWRKLITGIIGGAGALMALVGFIGGNVGKGDFLLPQGLLLVVLGLTYLWSFVSVRGTSDDLGYRAGLGMGLLGLIAFLVAAGRSALPPLFYTWNWLNTPPDPYFKPVGFTLMLLGLAYVAASAGLCSDNRIAVLTRRELVGFFYSPIAYIVLFGLTVVAGFFFADFLATIMERSPRETPPIEPIVRRYMFGLIPVICMVFIVPVLTMRLLSEEQRTGTLEVLLTAPVNETSVVLSKFLASLVFLLIVWAPWALFLVALRVEGGTPFDYRPLYSCFIALACMGAGFMGMGLFFSSLVRNQIASAILTFAGMLVLLGVFAVKMSLEGRGSSSPWVGVLGHMSFVDLWWESLDGLLNPRPLLFFLSMAVFWLFLTVKVLEIRRWS